MAQPAHAILALLGSLAVLHPLAAQSVLTTITVGREPTAILYDSIDRKLFVANNGSGTVSVIDPFTNTVTATIKVGEGANALCWSTTSNKLFVACAPVNGNGWVYVINAATNEIVNTVSVGRNPNALAWCESRNKIYCLNSTPNGPISILGGADLDSSLSVSARPCPSVDIPVIPIPGQTPNDVAYNPTSDRVYVSSAAYMQLGKVWVINPSDDHVETTVTCGYDAQELEVNPTDNRVFCSNHSSNTVSVIACSTNQRIGDLATLGEPHTARWIATDKLFVGEYWNRTVAFLRGDSLGIRGRFPVPGNPGNMIYLPAAQKLFVANYLSGIVSVCDARDGHEGVLADVEVGDGPRAMSLCPDLRRIYVANSWDSTVTVISDELPAPVTLDPLPLDLRPLLSVAPNPARAGTLLRLQLQTATCKLQRPSLTLRDPAGRTILTSAGASVLLPPTLTPGIYFCTLSQSRASATAKLAVR